MENTADPPSTRPSGAEASATDARSLRRACAAAWGLTAALIVIVGCVDLGAAFFHSGVECLLVTGGAVVVVIWAASAVCRRVSARLEETERGLRENSVRYRTLFEQAGDSILVLELAEDGPPVIRDVNEAGLRCLGYELDELVGRPITLLNDDALDPAYVKARTAETLSPEGGRFEVRRKRKDGSIAAAEVTTKSLAGMPRHVLCVERDITARKRAEEFGRMARAIPAILAAPGSARELVERCVAVLKEGAGVDAVGVRLRGAPDPDGAAHPGCPCGQVLSGRVNPDDPRFTRGGSFWTNDASLCMTAPDAPDAPPGPRSACAQAGDASIALVPIRSKDRVIGLLRLDCRRPGAFSRDILERLEALAAHIGEALAARRAQDEIERLRTAIEQAGEAIVITSAEGAILYVNPAFSAASGYSREEALGRNPRFLKSGRHDAAFYREMWDVLSSGLTWKGRVVNKRKDGTLFTEEMSVSPVRDAAGSVVNYVAVKRDITAQLHLEAELLHSQKMESVGRLAGGVAHDFNNILTSIKGYSEFALAGLPAGDPKRADIAEVLAASERATRLTRQLLAFSRKQILKPEVVDLNAEVGAAVKMLKRLIGEDIGLLTRLAPRPCLAKVDVGQMEQVFLNLAVNARDAMPKGGTLTFETAVVPPSRKFLLGHPGTPPGLLLRVSVTDTGAGMSEEVKERLFEPFFTTKEKGKGTGLGLSTVYGIVRQSGGEIEVESAPGRGTTFRIFLPLFQPASGEGRGDKAAVAAAAPRGSEAVLLVEDEDALRRMGARVLLEHGYSVLTAGSGAEGLKVLERRGRAVDLLLTDVVMPGMSGRELARAVAEKGLARRTLFVSGFTDDAIVQHGVLEPGLAFLYKPFSPDALLCRVREVIDGPAEQAKP